MKYSASEIHQCMLRKAYCISADNAHTVHPNYPEYHQDVHKPSFHKGIVAKMHCGQSYATDAVSNSILKEICKIHNVPLQDFIIK